MDNKLHSCETCKQHRNCGWEHKYNNEEHDCFRYEDAMNKNPIYNDIVDKIFDVDIALRHFCINYRKERSNEVFPCQGCPFHSDAGCYHAKFRGEIQWFYELNKEIDKREEKYAEELGWTGDE